MNDQRKFHTWDLKFLAGSTNTNYYLTTTELVLQNAAPFVSDNPVFWRDLQFMFTKNLLLLTRHICCTLFRKLGFGDSLFKREIKRGNHDWNSCSELGNAQNGGDWPDLVFKLETVGKWVEISEQSERFELREKREEVSQTQRKREKERPQVHSGIQFSFFSKSYFY